jgi:hypothetical protein
MILLAALAAAAAVEAPPPAASVPERPALEQAIARRDTEFFRLFFEGCDPARLRTMVTDDLEMYHDKDGFVWHGADEAVAGYAKRCTEQKKPDAWRSRRELVPGTVQIDPVPGFGAMETGEHVFYERRGNGPEKLVGRARFAQVWALAPDGQWRLARILSYAHQAAE